LSSTVEAGGMAALHARLRGAVPGALRRRLRGAVLGRDPDARREHLRVAAALTVAVAVGTTLLRLLGVGVSPVVWDAFYLLATAALLAVTAANVYWRGGLLTSLALVFAPVGAGLLVAHLGRGAFAAPVRTLGFGVALVSLLSLAVGGLGSLCGGAGRWLRDRWEADA
jgi:hypothetical protein